MGKIISGITIGFLLCGCGSEVEQRRDVKGYDTTGKFVATKGLLRNEACPAFGTEFTDRCLNAGFEILYAQGCSILCSGDVGK